MSLSPYYEDGRATVYVGDCRDVLPHLSPVETCITDPPYGLGFMGKGWDRGVPGVEFWTAIAGAVKPGASLLAFGGTRTWHRLACSIEDAGWEIRDCLMWLYGQGFPKSLDLSKALDKIGGHWRGRAGAVASENAAMSGANYDRNEKGPPVTAAAAGWGTALKPSWEPIILAMRPLDGTFAQNALRHGVAGLNIDGARIGNTRPAMATVSEGAPREFLRAEGRAAVGVVNEGRWPANLLLDEDAAALLDRQSGTLTSGDRRERAYQPIGYYANAIGEGRPAGMEVVRPARDGDSGGASRFFYTSKATRSERTTDQGPNTHPTVKPLDLMGYLCRLTATPTGGTVLDPFMGSGSTLIAALREGRRAIGIELDESHAETAVKRILDEPLGLDL